MAGRDNPAIVLQALLFGFSGLIVILLKSIDVLNTRSCYAIITLLLLYFVWLQVIAIRRRHHQSWLLNPAVICAFMTFIMGYGVSNVLFLLPTEMIDFLGLMPDAFPAMVTHQYLALLGAIMLYLGYWSPLAEGLLRPHAIVRFQRRYLPDANVPFTWAVPTLIGVSVVVRLYAMNQGLYGYGGDYSDEALTQTAGYSQYLSMLGGLGELALLIAALFYFNPEVGLRWALWFWVTLFIEVFFGFLSGMKSGVLMPLVICGFAIYLRQGVIPKRLILATFFMIVVAYGVIEPFRALRNQGDVALNSVSQTVSVLQQSIANGDPAKPKSDNGSVLLEILSRFNLSYIGAIGIEYADANKTLPADSPAFLADIFLAPLYALVPRFIWKGKPLNNLGLWYTHEVMGFNFSSSTAMGPIAYLYFAGGYPAVMIAFYIIGILQRVLWFRLTPWASLPGAIIMMALLAPVAVIDSAVNSIIITIIRDTLLLLILVRILFKRREKLLKIGQKFSSW